MSRIELETLIDAPPGRCFDLSLSVDVHLESAAGAGERVVSGRTSGLFELGDEVTWEARHFARPRRMTVRISELDRPRHFRDEMTRGPFRVMRHDHYFDAVGPGTRMRDVFEFSWLPLVDALVLRPYLRRLLIRRNATIKRRAELS